MEILFKLLMTNALITATALLVNLIIEDMYPTISRNDIYDKGMNMLFVVILFSTVIELTWVIWL